DLAKKARTDAKKDGDADKDDERESDVRVITRAVYRYNERGYLDRERPGHVWAVAARGDGVTRPVPRQVTKGEFDESDVAWAPEGTEIYFTSDPVEEPYHRPSDRDLYAVAADAGAPRRVARARGPSRDTAFVAY